MSQQKIGFLVLRLSMAGVYLYFGFSQLFDGVNWVSLVPAWVYNLLHVPPAMVVLGNGLFEVIAATLLAIGLWVGPLAILLALHLFFIALTFGITPIGVRDLGLSLATFSLFFLSRKEAQIT
jgi:uncharacterized membrane protein YphA (DoxX/SURF4 family)